MEVGSNENKAVSTEELCWALQIGDLDKVKELLQKLTSENAVIICRFEFVSTFDFYPETIEFVYFNYLIETFAIHSYK